MPVDLRQDQLPRRSEDVDSIANEGVAMATITSVDIVNDVKAVLHDVELLLQQAGAAGGAQARELRERAEARLGKMQAKLHDAQYSVVEGGKAAAGATNDWVHAHPWSTIGVASGIGFALGLVIGRR